MRCIFTNRTIGIGCFSIGTNRTIGQKGWELEKKWRGIRTEGVGARREMVGNQGRRVKQGDKR